MKQKVLINNYRHCDNNNVNDLIIKDVVIKLLWARKEM